MTVGFRIRDANTNAVVVDLTDRLSRITYTGTTISNVAGSVVIPDHTDGIPFFVCPYVTFDYNSGYGPNFSLNQSSGVLSWNAAPIAVPFYCGVY